MSNTICEESPWYALRVRNLNEFKISEFLTNNLGIQAFVPYQKIWKRRKGEKIVYSKPLISSYVFINENMQEISSRLLFSVSGVYGFLSKKGTPVSIPKNQIQSLRRFEESENPVYEIDYSKFKAKDRVEIIDGPLKGAVGNFIKTDEAKGRFIVELSMFNRNLCTELELGFIKPF